MPDLGPILNVILAVGLLLLLSVGAMRFLSRLVRRGPPGEPAMTPTRALHAAHEAIDDLELARVRSMLQRR